jgi:ABC-type nitrate/sulfonate/bicarbonate transport system ATPase subunit
MITVEAMTYRFRNGPAIFENFNWRVERGEAWAVIGPSGCGKTTLLYLLAGLYRPVAGDVRIDGHPIRRPRPRSGLVLQDHGLLPWATVRRNVGLGLTIRSFYGSDGRHAPADEAVNADEANHRVDHWLDKLGIMDLQGQYPSQLSRGQRQRTAIARTLVTRPDLLLLDEPFSALDAPTREDLQRLVIEQFLEAGLVYVIVTHDIEVAVAMGRRILILAGGTNRRSNVLENNKAGDIAYRYHRDFHSQCEQVRGLLGSRP